MKRNILIIVLILITLILTNSVVLAESPARLDVTIEGGFGINVRMVNTGDLPASNITYGFFVISNFTQRVKSIYYGIDDILPNEEAHIRNLVFFIGKIDLGAGAFSYFNGEEQLKLFLPLYPAFALGPFIIMVD